MSTGIAASARRGNCDGGRESWDTARVSAGFFDKDDDKESRSDEDYDSEYDEEGPPSVIPA